MKKFCFFVLTAVVLVLSSCNKGGNTVTPVSEKIQGPLGQYFEVVSKDYKAKNGKVSIEIKRIKEGFPEPWTEGMEVGYSDGEMEPQFTAEFQDADGSVISKDKTDKIWDKDELSAIAALGVDETASITFDVSEDAAQVKIGSTFKVNGGDKSNSDYYSTDEEEESQMNVAEEDIVVLQAGQRKCHIDGPANVRQQPDTKSAVMGSIKNGMVAIVSHTSGNIWKIHAVYNPNGGQAYTGNIVGYYTHKQNLIFDMDGSSDSNSYSSSSSGSKDWDALLDSYEQYVDKYISYAKKAAKGDMSALSEYPALMQKAQEFSNRMQGAQGDMSSSQWARYMKITNKMTQAAASMQ